MSNPATAVTDEKTGDRDYRYPPTGEMFPSVTTILGGTEGKPWLPGWAAGIAAEYAYDNRAALTALAAGKAAEYCEQGVPAPLAAQKGRDEAVAFAKKESERIRDIKRDTGGYVHDVAEKLVLWQASPEGRGGDLSLPLLPDHLQGAYYDDEPVEFVSEWMIEGYLNWVSDYDPEFLAAEMTVFHPGLKVAGTLDAIARLPGLGIGRSGRFVPGPGVRGCFDVKTGKHLSVTWPEQVGTYRRCPQCLLPLGDLHPTPPTEFGAVIHLRPEYPRCYRLMLISGADDAAAWNRFQLAAQVYHGRRAAKAKPGKVCYPLRADGTIQQPRIADLDGEGYGRAVGAFGKAGLGGIDLDQLAGMSAGQLLKVKHIGGATVDGARIMLADHGLHLKDEAPEMAKVA
jgi:hypothetical protein